MFRNSGLLFVTVIALSGCTACANPNAANPSPKAATSVFDPDAASLRLLQGMTEKEAVAAVGQPPTSANVTVCGGQNSPWNCRMLNFKASDNIHELVVYEAQSAGKWRVSSWVAL
jgi:hypothetical protein